MKRISALILSIIMVVSIILPVSAVDTDGAVVTVTPSATNVVVGDIVTFTVAVSGSEKAKSMAINLVYDTEVFELSPIYDEDNGANVDGKWLLKGVISAFDADETLQGVWAADSETDINTKVFTFALKAKKTTETGSVSCTYTIKNEGTAIPCSVQGAAVSVVENLPGDINGDGKVNFKDFGLLQQYLNGGNVTIIETVADVNDDGKINFKDFGLLQQHLNGWDVTLK